MSHSILYSYKNNSRANLSLTSTHGMMFIVDSTICCSFLTARVIHANSTPRFRLRILTSLCLNINHKKLITNERKNDLPRLCPFFSYFQLSRNQPFISLTIFHSFIFSMFQTIIISIKFAYLLKRNKGIL